MLKLIIPSKDRAAQLHLLLYSLKKNLLDSSALDIHILYKATDEQFLHGYEKLAQDPPLPINLIKEENFCRQFKDLIVGDYICLMTDDCIFYRAYDTLIEDTLRLVIDDVWCFSWRLGLNTTQQYYVTKSQQEPLDKLGYNFLSDEHFIKWNWKIRPSHSNYGYFISWDGHIYRSADLLHLCKDLAFTNPRHFESKLTDEVLRSTISRKNMVAPVKNNLVVNTVNVTQVPPIPAGLFHPVSLTEMNNRFLSGDVIDLDKFDFSGIVGCHDELPVKWRMGL
jgi:hypothetical protein